MLILLEMLAIGFKLITVISIFTSLGILGAVKGSQKK